MFVCECACVLRLCVWLCMCVYVYVCECVFASCVRPFVVLLLMPRPIQVCCVSESCVSVTVFECL